MGVDQFKNYYIVLDACLDLSDRHSSVWFKIKSVDVEIPTQNEVDGGVLEVNSRLKKLVLSFTFPDSP